MMSILTVLPSAHGAEQGSAVRKGVQAKSGLSTLFASDAASASFATLYGQQAAVLASTLQTAKGSATPSMSDLIAKLTAQLQSGTPLSTIVNQIAQRVAQSATQQLRGSYSASALDRLRTTIAQTIANALSPPGNAPPGSAAEQAAALASRLQQMVESLARDATNGAGQQNELSGQLLDADTAKELPAQHSKAQATTTASASSAPAPDVSTLVRSLLASAVSAVAQPAQAPVVQPLPQAPTQQVPSAPSAIAAPPAPITMANAPDLLARMLVRAAGADASVNGAAPAATGATALPAGTAQTPAQLAARFASLLADETTALPAAGDSGTQSGTSSFGSSAHSFAQNDQSTFANAFAATAAPASSDLGAQMQNTLARPAFPTAFDANAIVEQMVRGMVMRTNQQGTSEIRLQLQPENLGTVTMKLSVTGTQVNATVIAANADVRSAIVSGHQDLARSLASAGLTLSGFSVDVSGGDAGRERNQDRTGGFGRRYTVHELSGTVADDTQSGSSSGPSLLGAGSLDLFNYLA
jgi:flagellar hook-length control protein FliK